MTILYSEVRQRRIQSMSGEAGVYSIGPLWQKSSEKEGKQSNPSKTMYLIFLSVTKRQKMCKRNITYCVILSGSDVQRRQRDERRRNQKM